jgi:hypothetical protein
VTPEIIGRAVFGLMLATIACIVGIVTLAATDRQTEASITALATLGSGSAGAIAGLLTGVAQTPGAIVGGRRATDPHPVPAEAIGDIVNAQEAKAS